jgi:alpha-galactosidase
MRRILRSLFFGWACTLPFLAAAQTPGVVWLDDLSMQSFSEGIRPVKERRNYQNDSMRIAGRYFDRGVGLQSVSVIPLQLDGRGIRFRALIGADDMGNKSLPVHFYVLGDGKILYQSGPMLVGDAARPVDVDIRDVKRLGLLVIDTVGGISNKRTYANWAEARIDMTDGLPPRHIPNDDPAGILTPPVARTPRINSAAVFGVRPGHPFLFRIAATGERPMKFGAEGLPAGLKLDSNTGIITGKMTERGDYRLRVFAVNKYGKAEGPLKIRIGDTIALTPPIGWNGWNSWAHRIDADKVISSAKAMVDKGLANHGWTYVNIDDTWMGKRSGPLNALQPNEKFPDIKGMVDQIHAMGLKAGIYSTPYISTYAGFVGGSSDYPTGGETHGLIKPNRQPYMRIGPYRFEEQDAKQMAEWGFDFLKYDWRMDVNSSERMFKALRNSGRDIILSLSNNAPFDKVKDWVRTSNMYRTGPDIRDSWNSLFMTSFSLDKWGPYAGPGHWSDPDMMIVGNVTTGQEMHPTRLTPNEQYSHISMFALLSAPMLVGCPIEQLDAFTLNLLTNDEVIAVDQDPLGRSARFMRDTLGVQTWLKEMEDGSYVLGLFHTADYGKTPDSWFRWGNEQPVNYKLDWSKLGLSGNWMMRDVWRQKDIGVFSGGRSFSIPYHGVMLIRLRKK